VEEFGLSSKGSAVLNRLMEMGMTQEEAMQRISEMAQSGSYDLGNIALMDRENKMGGGMMIIGHNDVANSGIADILEKYRTIRSNL